MEKDAPLRWACDCGKMELELAPRGVRIGSRLICYCNSCRGADVYLRGNASGLTAHQGVEVLHTTPDYLRITKGEDALAAILVGKKGPLRWYAKCCGTPIVNSLQKPTTPFIGVILPSAMHFPQEPRMGAPKEVFTKYALKGSGAPEKDQGFAYLGFRFVVRMLGGWMRRSKDNIFVNEHGALISEPHPLTRSERESLYQLAREFAGTS